MTEPHQTDANAFRIVVLCGPKMPHQNTCATLINAGLNVVGICIANQKAAGVPWRYVLNSIRRKGLWPTLSRSAAKLLYLATDCRRDLATQARIFDKVAITQTLGAWKGPILYTKSYSDPAALVWLRELDADIFVVHTPYWVSQRVRQLPRSGIVLGGHPGITPYYRGSHAAFWAIYSGQLQDVGCTALLLDDEVDAGDIVAQDQIPIEAGDSFVTLAWKGMKRIAELQASALLDLTKGMPLPRRHVPVPENSVFDNPRLGEFLRYRWRQQRVR